MFLHKEPKELLPLLIHHWLLFCVDLWALSLVAVKGDEDNKPILGRPALFFVTWEMFTSHQIGKIETSR